MDGPDVTVRPLGPEDIESGVEVLVRAFNELDARVGLEPAFQTFSQARATLQMALRLDPHGAWAAVRGGRKVVGVAVSYRREGYVSIGPVAVHPLAQGRGVGRLLVRCIRSESQDADCFVLAAAAYNPHAFTLYRTEGFRVVYLEASFAGLPERRPEGGDARAASRRDLPKIYELDRELTGIDRARDLEIIWGMGHTFLRDDGYLATVRIGPSLGVGPAAARDAPAMHALLDAALAETPPGGVLLRGPANGVMFDRLTALGLGPRSLGAVMAAGTFPERTGEHIHPIFPEVL